jgi:hypothetical protein
VDYGPPLEARPPLRQVVQRITPEVLEIVIKQMASEFAAMERDSARRAA